MRSSKGSNGRQRRLPSIASTSDATGRRGSVAEFDDQTNSTGETALISDTDFTAIGSSLVDGIENLNPVEQNTASMEHDFDLPSVQVPYDLLDFMNQTDYLIENIDTLDFDLGLEDFPVFDVSDPKEVSAADPGVAGVENQGTNKSRFEVFKRTPWYVECSPAVQLSRWTGVMIALGSGTRLRIKAHSATMSKSRSTNMASTWPRRHTGRTRWSYTFKTSLTSRPETESSSS